MDLISDLIALGLTDNRAALYDEIHVLKAIVLLGHGPLGRKRLLKGLNLGEGSVRTLISKLKEMGVISEDRTGCSLTSKGVTLMSQVSGRLKFGHTQLMGEHPYEVSAIVRGAAPYVGRGLQERDDAIRRGAEGALIVSAQGGELWFPSLTNLTAEYPKFAEKVRKSGVRDGDIMIISWANDPLMAEDGALYSAIELMRRMGV